MRMRRVAVALTASVLAAIGAGAPSAAGAAHLMFHRPIVALGANQSSNWSGYNQGYLEKNNTQFKAVTGTWIVPKATQHKPNEAEYSSAWVGIGGGCVDAGCTVTDSTLIQTGTEMDVSASGQAAYSAWWEIIPQPATPIPTSQFPVAPGDVIRASIVETSPTMWHIALQNPTQHKKFSVDTSYSSTYNTVEWIVETPLVLDDQGNVTVGPLPSLSKVHFFKATVNGANAGLVAAEEMQLSFGDQLATPSAPNSHQNGFNDCVYRNSCPAPAH